MQMSLLKKCSDPLLFRENAKEEEENIPDRPPPQSSKKGHWPESVSGPVNVGKQPYSTH